MFKNYFKTTLRSLLSSKLYSCINILGLAIGLASTILIGLFVFDELSYDKQYADVERIYRVSRDFPEQGLQLAAAAPQIAGLLQEDFPGIEQVARLFGGQLTLRFEDNVYSERNIRFADNDFFRIFNFEWLAGDPGTALVRPNTIVLTKTMAQKYFGNQAALGQTILLENTLPLEVTGVIEDLPHNTHLDLSVIVALDTLLPLVGEQYFNNWGHNGFYTYIKLKPGVDIESISSQFPAFLNRHISENASDSTGLTAMAVTDLHLHSKRQNEMLPPGSINTVYVFSATALFILLIACFNFMNLSTARSSRRGKEVGIRKTLGASRGQVAWQFIGESVLLALLASALALVMVEIALPVFNSLLGRDLALNLFSDMRLPLVLIVLGATVGLLAGSYPAVFLSAFQPSRVLRSALASGSALLRNTLVVIQFSIAIILVVATLVVVMQMRYARDIELGFTQEQVVVLTGSPTAGFGTQWESFRQELLSNADILAVTSSGQTPLEANTNSVGARAEGQPEGEGRSLPNMKVDYDFFKTYDIPLLAGRGFSADYPNDRILRSKAQPSGGGVVLNRLAAEQFGWTPEEAINKRLNLFFGGPAILTTIVGVADNSYFESVRSPLKPMVFILPEYLEQNTATLSFASLRLSGRNLPETVAFIDDKWREFMPDYPLVRNFLDERFDAMFQAETWQGQLFYTFAMLAIFIACMGLYGLASFNAERRRKEIGVRKVMGGSVMGIVMLLTNEFSKLVLLSNLIAWPIAWFAMERWLQNFAYRIDLTPMIFIGSGLIALCIAWVTVGGTAAKAASAKPVLALRYE
jgi:putative ABC transport system permease protein